MSQSKFSIRDTYLKKDVTFDQETLKVYTCGPTVYGYQHIGNMYATMFGNMIVDAAKMAGYDTSWVVNITDVGHLVSDGDEGEDKIEKGAKRDGKTVEEIVAHYTDDFKNNLEKLNIKLPKGEDNPKATDYIVEQIQLTQDLLDKGLAYELEDGVYFNYEEFLKDANSGDVHIQKIIEIIEKEKSGASSEHTGRDIVNTKKSPQDFALWKFVDENALQKWKYLGRWGCPGWHGECVCMSHARLGFPIDIHTGGEDHIDVHHRNEMLQASALGHIQSKSWSHLKFLLIDGKKMSKSQGTMYYVNDIVERGFDPLAFRLMLMEHHYSEQLNFTWEKLEQSQSRLYNLRKLAAAVCFGGPDFELEGSSLDIAKYIKPLLNDLNTPLFIQKFQELLTESCDMTQRNVITLDKIAAIYYLDKNFTRLSLWPEIPEEVKMKAEARWEFKNQKDYAKADECRDDLLEMGWVVDDYATYWAVWKK